MNRPLVGRYGVLGSVVMVGALAARIAFADDTHPLCVNQHPAPRATHLTYGGLEIRPGYQRDHIIPLGLGGPDTAANVRYVPWDRARPDDEIEKAAERAYCRGQLSLTDARAMVARQKLGE